MPEALSIHALTTLARVKAAASFTIASGDDDNTTRLINAASRHIEQQCGRHFERNATQADTLAGYGTDKITVLRPPINSLTSITFDGSSVDLTDVTARSDETGIIERDGGWNWTAHFLPNVTQYGLPGTEQRVIVVTYDGGYVLPQDASPTLPEDLEDAAIQLVLAWMTPTSGIKSQRLLSYAVTYDVDRDMPARVAAVIARYRREVNA